MIILTERIPIKIWCEEPEEGALGQAKNIANLPFAYHHIAVMPDVRQGYGMPIGGVLAAPDALKSLLAAVYRRIPLGFKHHKSGRSRPGTCLLRSGNI